jgi:hypothetical protein
MKRSRTIGRGNKLFWAFNGDMARQAGFYVAPRDDTGQILRLSLPMKGGRLHLRQRAATAALS